MENEEMEDQDVIRISISRGDYDEDEIETSETEDEISLPPPSYHLSMSHRIEEEMKPIFTSEFINNKEDDEEIISIDQPPTQETEEPQKKNSIMRSKKGELRERLRRVKREGEERRQKLKQLLLDS